MIATVTVDGRAVTFDYRPHWTHNGGRVTVPGYIPFNADTVDDARRLVAELLAADPPESVD